MISTDSDRCRALATLSPPVVDHQRADLVTHLSAMADATRRMIADAGIALQTRDPERVRAVAAAAGRIDLMHIELERDVVDQIIQQRPTPDDLWHLLALLDTGVLLGRMGETGVALARLALGPNAPDVVDLPVGLAHGLTDMTTYVGHMLADAVRPWQGNVHDIASAPTHLARQLEEAHDTFFQSLVTAARASLPLPAVLWVDRAAGLIHEAGQLAVDIAETACMPTTSDPA